MVIWSFVPIDGVGGILGQAGPTYLRPASAGQYAFIPCKGNMVFDTADLANMQANGTLGDVITHEMGHVLGIGTIWTRKNKLANSGTTNPSFIGRAAMVEYGKLKGTNVATAVPVENTGGPGTANSHWRESIFRNELMSGFIAAANNPLSRVTVASLQDLGYVVDITKAEPYALANLMDLAENGLLMSAAAHGAHDHPHALPIFPITLGDESM